MDVETVFAVWIILLVVVFAQAFLTHHLCRMLSASHAREREWRAAFDQVCAANDRLKRTCDEWERMAVPRFTEGVTAEERPEGDGWMETVFIANDGTRRRAWQRTVDQHGYCGTAGSIK